MLRRGKAFLSLAVLSLASPHASAYFGPPTISPAAPIAGQSVTLSVPWGGGCDVIGGSISDPNQGVPQVTMEGSVIDVLFYGASVQDVEWCNLPDGVTQLALGPFPAGAYEMHVRLWHHDSGFAEILTIGDLPMAVGGGAAPVSLPAIDSTAQAGLALLLAVVATTWLRGRRSKYLHRARDASRGFRGNQEMHMVAHQHIGMDEASVA